MSSVKLDPDLLKSVIVRFLGRFAWTYMVQQAKTAKWLKRTGKL